MTKPQDGGFGRARTVAAAVALALVLALCGAIALTESIENFTGLPVDGSEKAQERLPWSPSMESPDLESRRQQARSIDLEAIERAIQSGQLSDQEALFYQPLVPMASDQSTSFTDRGR